MHCGLSVGQLAWPRQAGGAKSGPAATDQRGTIGDGKCRRGRRLGRLKRADYRQRTARRSFFVEAATQRTDKRLDHIGEQRMLARADEDFRWHSGRQLDVFAEVFDGLVIDHDVGPVVAHSGLLVGQRVSADVAQGRKVPCNKVV
jgi:hypothetical protein